MGYYLYVGEAFSTIINPDTSSIFQLNFIGSEVDLTLSITPKKILSMLSDNLNTLTIFLFI